MANKFKVWIDTANDNVQTSDVFANDNQRQNGFVAGEPASAIRVNSALRQANLAATGLVQACDDIVANNLDLRSTVNDVKSAIRKALDKLNNDTLEKAKAYTDGKNPASSDVVEALKAKVEANASTMNTHISSKTNPHSVTKAQIGLSDVDNTSDNDKPISIAQKTAIDAAKKAGTDAQSSINSHISSKTNPHSVTKAQIGLDNVDNVRQYSTNNPPPYPVTSVNGKTGAVTVDVDNVANATNVTTTINGKKITDIFESNGTTVKNATNAANATSTTDYNTSSGNIKAKFDDIDRRLTNLGFKQGIVTSPFINASTSWWAKEGNVVYGRIDFNDIPLGTANQTLQNIGDDFPKPIRNIKVLSRAVAQGRAKFEVYLNTNGNFDLTYGPNEGSLVYSEYFCYNAIRNKP